MTPRALPPRVKVIHSTPRSTRRNNAKVWRWLPLCVGLAMILIYGIVGLSGTNLPGWAGFLFAAVIWTTMIVSSNKDQTETVTGLEHRVRELELTTRKLERAAGLRRD